jgi:hypothetical protein
MVRPSRESPIELTDHARPITTTVVAIDETGRNLWAPARPHDPAHP